MKKYKVYIYEEPYCYQVEASNRARAELKAVDLHNDGNYDRIYKTEIVRLVKHLK